MPDERPPEPTSAAPALKILLARLRAPVAAAMEVTPLGREQLVSSLRPRYVPLQGALAEVTWQVRVRSAIKLVPTVSQRHDENVAAAWVTS